MKDPAVVINFVGVTEIETVIDYFYTNPRALAIVTTSTAFAKLSFTMTTIL